MALSCMHNEKMQYNTYLLPNCLNFHVLEEIGIEEHFGDIRFKTRSGNMANACMHDEKYAI